MNDELTYDKLLAKYNDLVLKYGDLVSQFEASKKEIGRLNNELSKHVGQPMDEAKEKILAFLSNNTDFVPTSRITGQTSLSEAVATFHLEELHQKNMVSNSLLSRSVLRRPARKTRSG
jgi:hypothetical protein